MTTIGVTLNLERATPPVGEIRIGEVGPWVRFVGWLQLIQILLDVVGQVPPGEVAARGTDS